MADIGREVEEIEILPQELPEPVELPELVPAEEPLVPA